MISFVVGALALLASFGAEPPPPPSCPDAQAISHAFEGGPITIQGGYHVISDLDILHTWDSPAINIAGGYVVLENVSIDSTLSSDTAPALFVSGGTVIVRNSSIDSTAGSRLPVQVGYGSYIWISDTTIDLPPDPSAIGVYITSSQAFITSGTQITGQGVGYAVVAHRSASVDINDIDIRGTYIGVQAQYGAQVVRHSPSRVETVYGVFQWWSVLGGTIL